MTTIGEFQTTGIGSLPHHNVDAALELSFRSTIPFLPQIPIRNPWEFMIPQALEGLPGLQADAGGSATVHLDLWKDRGPEFDRKLTDAFARPATELAAFQAFEPTASSAAAWQPFVWELEERGILAAKVQIAGPLTAQWSVRTRDGAPAERTPGLASQIFRLVLARALSMTRRLRASGILPVLYLDEPALYALAPSEPRHAVALRELALLVQTLRKDGAVVGLHCCSNTAWEEILGLELDILSLDAALSLRGLLAPGREIAVRGFIARGGRLSLGMIPTTRSSVLHSIEPRELLSETLLAFGAWKDEPALISRALREALYTPACGLALHTVADAELVAGLLAEVRERAQGLT